ncbi:unnamed protein product [Rotaria magnacalcarata]|uniref:Uncharacterized protein n=2 Tax=Rotaria magnacalcarata TaxID=392030 RepID=A0A816YGY0_9BILA|nr:unnamed protein product [Rotaria magnacalcarata]CAF1678421.1 unnamed protein product [Rotaria magnacalcarata]CAF2022188.1 unnamed protein product [Rotaria magnacalcarata]CAF2040294.1 unnamed protein product [Rotaria magnacalcarata]CAF2156672.1 unnamed protein product [Rotaria magnacalcarata]
MSINYQNYPQGTPAVVQPQQTGSQPIYIIQNQNRDVQHGCHCILWLVTAGLWTPCWIAACCGCCCQRPC